MPTGRSSRTWSKARRSTRPSFDQIDGALANDWTWKRIDRLVRSILLTGAYELVHRKDVPLRVVINEYVEIAHAFYDQREPTFVNSVLDRGRGGAAGGAGEAGLTWRRAGEWASST